MDDLSSTTQDVLLLATEQLERSRKPRVAVLGEEAARTLTAQLRARYADAVVNIVPLSLTATATHVSLCRANPYHLIVDLGAADGPAQVARFRQTFMHVRAGGCYLVAAPVGNFVADPAAEATDLVDVANPWEALLAQVAAAPPTPPQAQLPEETKDLAWVGRAIAKTERHGQYLLIRSRESHLAKLHDEELEQLLDVRRPRIGSTLARRSPGRMVPAGTYADSSSLLGDEHFTDPYSFREFALPALYLRRYVRPICAPSQVLVNRGCLLPDSFRHHQARRLMNNHLVDSAKQFAQVRHPLDDPRPLPGAYFYFDSEWPGHYGHTMTEQLSRMWAFERARAHDPDIKLLTTLPPTRTDKRLAPWELDLLACFGIGADDIVVFGDAVQPDRLYAASPMFSLPEYVSLADHPRYQSGFVHPELLSVWDHVRTSLLDRAQVADRPDRIFCSRRVNLKRACRNVDEVERFFADQGFTVLYPEDYSLPDQVALFNGASTIAGLAGSGLFTIAFCREPKLVLMVSSQSYTARNEYLISAVRGHHLRVAWSRPEVAHPEGLWQRAAFGSAFTVDLKREGEFLRQVIGDLRAGSPGVGSLVR